MAAKQKTKAKKPKMSAKTAAPPSLKTPGPGAPKVKPFRPKFPEQWPAPKKN
jgi:hypothetical protein